MLVNTSNRGIGSLTHEGDKLCILLYIISVVLICIECIVLLLSILITTPYRYQIYAQCDNIN